MEIQSAVYFEKIKNLLVARDDFINQTLDIIYQISGVNLKIEEIVWRSPVLIIKTTAVARNLIFRHREKILARLADRFDRLAPQTIR